VCGRGRDSGGKGWREEKLRRRKEEEKEDKR
jgi:hypothetical protein